MWFLSSVALFLILCSQAPPSPLCWIVHLTTSISASALILASQLPVFTWNIQVFICLSTIQLYPRHMLYMHSDDWNFISHFLSAIGLESCPEPQTPSYGIRQGDRFMVGDVVQFSCEQGYSLQVKLQPKCVYCFFFLLLYLGTVSN